MQPGWQFVHTSRHIPCVTAFRALRPHGLRGGAPVKLKEHIVDRKKPSLTSPWKVGFLVALLLVVTALGVSYFITGTFGISWHWIQVGGLSPMTWKFHLGAFLEEMVPLLLLTSLLAFGAYVLVAGAVRRYKAYVDSGVEYKQLLKSIKSIEDLESEDIGDRLKGHPELREFLLNVKHRVGSLERHNTERVMRHTVGAQQAQVTSENRAALASDCAALANAVDGGRDQFPAEIELSVPELKQIERALRRFFAAMPSVTAVDPSDGAVEALKDSVRSTIDALRRDVAACGSGAREMEEAIAAVHSQLDSGTPKTAGNASAVEKRCEAVGAALGELGEETRRIAIASALQASGGPEADTIKVAEDLKTLATRFNTVARHWSETVPMLKDLFGAGSARDARPDASGAVVNATNRVRLWGERAVAMNEHVRSLERAIGMPGSPNSTAVDSSSVPDRLDSAPVSPAARLGDDEIVARDNARMFAGDSSEDISFVDIPGFEKERRLFVDSAAEGAASRDDRFVVDNQQDRRWDLSEEREEEKPASAQPTSSKPAASDSDGFLTGPRPTVSVHRVDRTVTPQSPRPGAPKAPIELEPASSVTATLDADADALDLYALGAVDCVQTT
jgi:hypothetical protein